jgi:secreted PhoX family phosphatase
MSAIFKPATSPDTLFIDADDRINNLSDNGHFDNVLHARLGRRALFKSALGTGATAAGTECDRAQNGAGTCAQRTFEQCTAA